jgi:hypothetical protein
MLKNFKLKAFFAENEVLKKQIKDIIDLKKCWLNDSNPSNKY